MHWLITGCSSGLGLELARTIAALPDQKLTATSRNPSSTPDAVREIHLAYFQAGADIVSTNTFSSTAIAQADYGMEALVPELNRVSAQIVREAAVSAPCAVCALLPRPPLPRNGGVGCDSSAVAEHDGGWY